MNNIENFGIIFAKGMIEGFQALDSEKIAGGINNIFVKVFENLSLNFNGESTGAKIAEVIHGIIKSLQMGNIGEEFGKELGIGVKKFAYPVAMAIGDGAGYLAKGIVFKTMPYFFVATLTVVGAPLTLFFMYYKAKHQIGRPALAIEMRKKTIFSFLYNNSLVNRIKDVYKKTPKPKTPIFNLVLNQQIESVRKSLINLQKNKGNLQNIMLYGPPGTGKTMVAEDLLEKLDMDYIKMSGGDLPQYIRRGEHVTELNKLMQSAKNAKRPTILFIDEAEAFAKSRKGPNPPSDERIELLDAFLNQTGKAHKNLVIIMATNCIESIDEAVLSRMDHKIQIDPPGLEERTKMIKKYAKELFGKEEQQKYFGDDNSKRIAKEIEGFTGRTISKLLNDILGRKGATDDNQLTEELIDQAVLDFKKGEQIAKK